MNESLLHEGAQRFRERFGQQPKVAAIAPGRVEILGNHTDYNGGGVLTVAIDRYVAMFGARGDENTVALFSEALQVETGFTLDGIEPDAEHRWADYIKGVLVELRRLGVEVGGFNAYIGGDLPIGAGVSSSAALELAAALLIQGLYPYEMDNMEMARLCQRAENHFVGMPCGLLDQFSSLFGQKNAALFLDCRTLEHRAYSLGDDAPLIALCDSGVKHRLVEGEYRSRRQQCESAARKLGERLGREIDTLCQVSSQELDAHQGALDEVEEKRARHVILEHERVLNGAEALKRDDLALLGEMMFESHASSRDLFENSCPELDALVEIAREAPGCVGAKLTGGGFGGATVNLVVRDQADAFVAFMENRAPTRLCAIGAGAARIEYPLDADR